MPSGPQQDIENLPIIFQGKFQGKSPCSCEGTTGDEKFICYFQGMPCIPFWNTTIDENTTTYFQDKAAMISRKF